MGTKSLFYCSSTMFQKHKQCLQQGLTRIEVSKELYSPEEEEAFLKNQSSLDWYKEVVSKFKIEISKKELGLNHHIQFKTFWESFFGKDGFQHTLMINKPDCSAVIYGKNKITQHYVGLKQDTGPRLNLTALKRRYMLPGRPYTFIGPDNIVFEGQNANEFMQLPILPFNYKHSLRHNFGLPKNYKYFIELDKEEHVSRKQCKLDQQEQLKTKQAVSCQLLGFRGEVEQNCDTETKK